MKKKKTPKIIPFETALKRIGKIQKDEDYARKVYGSLANVVWVHDSKPKDWQKIQEDMQAGQAQGKFRPEPKWQFSCSWRAAGGIVAGIRNKDPKNKKSFDGELWNMDYMEFYCSGNEGVIDEEVSEDLKKLGWEPDTDYYERMQVVDSHRPLNDIQY